MRIFLDTANIEEVREAVKLGVVSGVTTNPTLMAKERGVEYMQRVVEICEAVHGPVSAECIARDAPGIVAEAREVAGWHPDVVVKIPIDAAGLEATAELAREGVKVNMTLVFSVNQALLAALAGATYISPFVGRLDDAGHDGMQVVRESVTLLDRYRLPSQIISASLRHPRHVIASAQAGAHVATMPYAVLMAMLKHPLTDVGIERFLADAQQYSKVKA
jgi:transaldolase